MDRVTEQVEEQPPQQQRERAHPTPRKYLAVAAVLGLLTAVEVAIFYIEALENMIVPLFFVLSGVKFALVVMFYMHLKFDSRLFSAFFVGGLLLAAALLLSLLALFRTILL